MPAPSGAFDLHFPFGTRFRSSIGRLAAPRGTAAVDTRPSLLYTTLFATLGENPEAAKQVLIGIAIFLGVIELVALFIGGDLPAA